MKEISLHILDIAENSVKASATRITISLSLNRTLDLISLVIEDDGFGMNSSQVARILDPFYTTRTTRKVGLGLPLLKYHAEATGGAIRIESEPGRGTKVTATFGYSHLDRQPVGDIGGVVANLAASFPSIDFILQAESETEKYHFSSKEIKDLMDGISLSIPDINQGIKEMINSNLYTILYQ